mmetsp:Transcript_97284/g.197633  ORF Transcript_97284/g.197633 Transcript_97284/m.197633 type:complete len:291 (-) Transcript_97284:677-1549(-)
MTLLLLLVHYLEVLVDDGHGKEDAGTAADGTEEVRHNGEGTDAGASEGCCSRDVTVQHPGQVGVAVARHHHVLIPELLGDVARRGARDVDPGFREEGAGDEHEGHVEQCVDGVGPNVREGVRRRHVIHDATHRNRLPRVLHLLPLPQEIDEHVRLEAAVKELREEVQVRDQRRLQDDGNVRGVEQLDGVRAHLAPDLLVLHGQVHAEALEVDHDEEDQHGGKEGGDVRRVLSVESLLECHDLVALGEEEVEERDDRALKLGALASVHGAGAECLPDDVLADVCGDEEGDA